jgi:hypothetical protein
VTDERPTRGQGPLFGSEVPGRLETATRSLTSNTPRRPPPLFFGSRKHVSHRTDAARSAVGASALAPRNGRRDAGPAGNGRLGAARGTCLGGEQSPWKKRATRSQQWLGSLRTRRRSKALKSRWPGPVPSQDGSDPPGEAAEAETRPRCGRQALRSRSGDLGAERSPRVARSSDLAVGWRLFGGVDGGVGSGAWCEPACGDRLHDDTRPGVGFALRRGASS